MADGNMQTTYGDTWSFTCQVTDDATPPVPIDLTNATINFLLETRSTTVADLQLQDVDQVPPITTAGITISRNNATGTFIITCSDAVMATLDDNRQYTFHCIATFDPTHLVYPDFVMTLCVCTLSVEERAV